MIHADICIISNHKVMKAENDFLLKIAIIITILLSTQTAYGQTVVTSTYLEQTQISPKLGYSIGYQFHESPVELGAFQQRSMTMLDGDHAGPTDYEKDFTGLYMNYEMLQNRLLTLCFKIRTGVSNGENFVITPSVMGDYQIFRKVQLSGGLGVRAFRPTLLSGIKITI